LKSNALTEGLTYNLKSDYPFEASQVDARAEYDDEVTIAHIERALCRFGHRVVLLPDRSDLVENLSRAKSDGLDIVFNLAEGRRGRNRESLVPAILEWMDIPYTGSDPLTLGLSLDKGLCKTIAAAAGVRTAPHAVVDSADGARQVRLRFPLFVKPLCEGSSKGVRLKSKAETTEELVEWVVRTYRQPALVEEFLHGREFSVGVLGNGPEVLVFPLLEVRLWTEEAGGYVAGGPVYSFDHKVNNLEEFVCPASVQRAWSSNPW